MQSLNRWPCLRMSTPGFGFEVQGFGVRLGIRGLGFGV